MARDLAKAHAFYSLAAQQGCGGVREDLERHGPVAESQDTHFAEEEAASRCPRNAAKPACC